MEAAASGVKDGVGLAMSVRPTCILCLGMAGSGKTTFVQVASLVKLLMKVSTIKIAIFVYNAVLYRLKYVNLIALIA